MGTQEVNTIPMTTNKNNIFLFISFKKFSKQR